MDNDKVAWFGGGVVVGLLIGFGVAMGFGYSRLAESEARAAEAADQAAHEAMRAADSERMAVEGERRARMRATEAEKAARDALKQIQKDKPVEKSEK